MTAASKNLSAIKSRLAGPNVGMEAAMLAGEKIIAESRQAATMRRAESWQKVKDEAPESANFIMSLSATFGKPKALLVVIDDEKVVNTYAAADIPATAPTITPNKVAMHAMTSRIHPPARRRDRTSRPSASVPNGYEEEGFEKGAERSAVGDCGATS